MISLKIIRSLKSDIMNKPNNTIEGYINNQNEKKAIKFSDLVNKERRNLINLREVLNKDIEIIGFEVRKSLKYNSDYVVIKTKEGIEYITFSTVIKRQLEEHKDIFKDFSLICKVRERKGKTGIKYLCLE